MNLTFNGLDEAVATFSCPSPIQIGDVVTLTANGTVVKATADKDLVGTCVSKSGTIVGIMLRGVAELGYNDTAPATAPKLGLNTFVTDGANKVKAITTGRPCLALSVNTTTKKVTILL